MNISPWLVIFAVLAIWFFLLRTRATPVESMPQFEALINRGRPVVVDFFSNT